MSRKWTNLSYANVATTSPAAHRIATEWADSLARGGAAEFDAEAEKNGMMPLRAAAASLLSCDLEDICCGSSATGILSSVAWAVMPQEGQNVVSTRASFPSTVYPWNRVSQSTGAEIRLAPYDDNYYTDPEGILSLIDENTAIVTLSHVEYANGQRYDLDKMAEAAHSVGAMLVVDATQSMGMAPIDAYACGADVIVASGYKWLRGSYGAAVAFISPRVRKNLNPGLIGFRSHEDIWDMKSDRLTLPEDASRFEFTTLHFGVSQGLAASIEELVSIGIQEVWEHDLRLADAIIEGALSRGLRVASPTNDDERSAIVSIFPPQGADCSAIVTRLQDEYGILVTNRSGMIRVSPHIDNSSDQIEALFDALDEILRNGGV
tara:strand:+ start:768 stop:1898 length:1131 start_codon:yes stop_codon:yes gene_type:complete